MIERLMLFAKCADKDAASVRALELLGKGLGMFVEARAARGTSEQLPEDRQGVTWPIAVHMSAYDPKRTSAWTRY
jgi:hypothetical protein